DGAVGRDPCRHGTVAHRRAIGPWWRRTAEPHHLDASLPRLPAGVGLTMAELEYEDIYRALSVPESNSSLSRRRFIQAALACGGAAMAAPYINMASAFAAQPLGRNDGILVFVFMGGGCDSLNLVVP